MPHCSSEHDEQFESMVGGAAMERASTWTPVSKSSAPVGIDDFEQSWTTNSAHKARTNEVFHKIIINISKFLIKKNITLPSAEETSDILLYANGEWITLEEFKTQYGVAYHNYHGYPLEIGTVRTDIDSMKQIIKPYENSNSDEKYILDYVLATIITESQNVVDFHENQELQTYIIKENGIMTTQIIKRPETDSNYLECFSNMSYYVLNALFKNLMPEDLGNNTSLLKKQLTIYIKNVFNCIQELKIVTFATKTVDAIIKSLVHYKLSDIFLEILTRIDCGDNNYISRAIMAYLLIVTAGIGINNFIVSITPTNKRVEADRIFMIQKANDFNSMVKDMTLETPADELIKALNIARQFIEASRKQNPTILDEGFYTGQIQILDGIENTTNLVNNVKTLENIKLLGLFFVQVTTGSNQNALPSSAAAAAPPPPALAAAAAPPPPALAAAAEEKAADKRLERRRPKPGKSGKWLNKKKDETLPPYKAAGGAPKRITKKHTKKGKSKMLKGKSKKHLKKDKKGKKTGKKVRFHSASKKSKKNTRKRR